MSAVPWHLQPPDYAEIEAAAARIAPACVVTPLLESPALNERLGGRLLIKAEGLQRTGSFKLRGASNRIAQLTDDELKCGVVAYSSGNHAQAVAAAAAARGTHAVIVMPADAPRAKLDKTRRLGAEIVTYDRQTGDRVAIADALVQERGLVLVPPFDDRRIIAGQGTVGREVSQQASAMGAMLHSLLVPCSGGGLIAGCALALQALSPGTQVLAVEPAGFDDTARSLAAGQRVANDGFAQSICDALQVTTPGELTFGINRRLLHGAVVVNDMQTIAAMQLALDEFGLVVEPGGAVALAAVLAGKVAVRGRNIAVVLSGANVDREDYARLMGMTA